MAMVVEQVQKEEAVDVYRTVVKLLRTRHHFITNQVLFWTIPYNDVGSYL